MDQQARRRRIRLLASGALGGGGILPFTMNFATLQDGALPSPLVGSTWSIVSGKAINTPVTFGADAVVNGDFSSGTGWSVAGGMAVAAGLATHTPGAAGFMNRAIAGQAANQWRKVTYDIVGRTAGGGRTELGGLNIDDYHAANGSYQSVGPVYPPTSTTLLWLNTDSAFDGSFDNATNRLMTLSEFYAVLPPTISDVTIQIPIAALNAGTPVGIIANLDSRTNPQNYVIAWLGAYAAIDKCVAGVLTPIVRTATPTFVANQIFKLVKTGTTYKMSYNGIQLGPDGTIADAGVISNTIHGIFSGHPSNQIGSVSVQP